MSFLGLQKSGQKMAGIEDLMPRQNTCGPSAAHPALSSSANLHYRTFATAVLGGQIWVLKIFNQKQSGVGQRQKCIKHVHEVHAAPVSAPGARP